MGLAFRFNNGYISYNYVKKGENDMSSVIAIYSPDKVVVGSDSRNINIETGKINTDNKTKIVQCERALIGITGRTDYYWKGEKKEIEDILQETTIWDAITNMKIQCPPGQNTYLLIFQPFHLNYNGENIQKIKAFAVTISNERIEVNEYIEKENVICSGVLHSCELKYAPITDSWENEIIKRIKYDEQKEIENGRKSVGGEIKIFEMLSNGKINQLQ